MTLKHCLEVSYANDAAALKAALLSAANHLGFERVTAFFVFDRPGGQPQFMVTVENYPPGYFAIANDRARGPWDPLMQTVKRQNTPVAWDRSLYQHHGAEDLWEMSAAYGYKAGIGTALHLPNGRHHAFGVCGESALPHDPERLHGLMAQVHLFGCHANEAASRIFQRLPACDTPLTDRELQCLRWTVAGKTAWEIGQIMHLSERTACAVLSRATRKLDCVSKHQAALRALQLGLIAV